VNTRCSIEFYYILVDTIMVQDLVVCFFFRHVVHLMITCADDVANFTVRSANACYQYLL
jgi:hypothetical protein